MNFTNLEDIFPGYRGMGVNPLNSLIKKNNEFATYKKQFLNEQIKKEFYYPELIKTTPNVSVPQKNECNVFAEHLKNCKHCENIYSYNSFHNNLLELLTYVLTGILFIFILDILVNKKK